MSVSKHMPSVPPAKRSPNGPHEARETPKDDELGKHLQPPNISEQGSTANIKQNTTNAGAFRGRRVK
jgi:hypothetical protein